VVEVLIVLEPDRGAHDRDQLVQVDQAVDDDRAGALLIPREVDQ
jgi:hypothetical protein